MTDCLLELVFHAESVTEANPAGQDSKNQERMGRKKFFNFENIISGSFPHQK
jgi:hypothetical protein